MMIEEYPHTIGSLTTEMADALALGAKHGAVDLKSPVDCDAFLKRNDFATGARLAFGEAARKQASAGAADKIMSALGLAACVAAAIFWTIALAPCPAMAATPGPAPTAEGGFLMVGLVLAVGAGFYFAFLAGTRPRQ